MRHIAMIVWSNEDTDAKRCVHGSHEGNDGANGSQHGTCTRWVRRSTSQYTHPDRSQEEYREGESRPSYELEAVHRS